MKKKLVIQIAIFLIACIIIAIPAMAAENDQRFEFELTANGKDTVEVQPDDIITVTLRLRRTDASDQYTMYAMQDEICYDGTFFELVEGSEMLGHGIVSTDISKSDRYREFYMNYLSMSGGTQWDSEMLIGSIQLRVIGESGVTTISNQDYLVSLQDGSGSYPCQANEVTVILSTECVVTFVTNGGTPIPNQTVWYGEQIHRPEDPIREGYTFEGWYKDIHLTEEWDFNKNTVQGNMSLYAKWSIANNDETNKPIAESNYWVWFCIIVFIVVMIYIIETYRKKAHRHQNSHE